MQVPQDTLIPPTLPLIPAFKSIFTSKHHRSVIHDKLLDVDYLTARVMVIPSWIYRYLVKNKVNIIDINNYKVIKKFLSIDDITDWVILNDSLHLFENGRKYRVSTQDVMSLFTDITPDELELIYKINSISLNDCNIKERINNEVSVPINETEEDYKPYKVVSTTDMVIVTLDEGIIPYLNISYDNVLNFTRSILKECYRINKIKDVSEMDLFKLYVRLL